MPGDIASTEIKIDPPPTIVGATGLSPSDNHPTSFYVALEVDEKQGRTAELAPSPQLTIEWNACFLLRTDKASYIALRLYKCWKSVIPGHLRRDKADCESRATTEQLPGCDSKLTNTTLLAKAPFEKGFLSVKVERAAYTKGERPVVGELDKAIDHHRAPLRLRPPVHPDRSSSLNNLALTLSTRFKQRGDRADLDEAIELNRAALELHPPGHPLHSTSPSNLVVTPSTRFKQFMDRVDLDEAAELHRDLYAVSYTSTFSGWFNSVIGTMWAVDEIPRHMISAFFKVMFEHTKAASSLNLGCVHGGPASCPPRAEGRVRSRWGFMLPDAQCCVRY
ncbi:hypothetical protein BV22DRAFT_1123568 [Leucogyrophana mollusca]|uniref:Uncharacterized protein n=1 Tax=Leucogyrophana mollusca TaxID=85980 RepID=A0ACB8B0Y4_9AGAM|nr:hypothetical protein BV22DRAFT_1123568 [Leucogyrophana mollusca]